MKTNRVCFLSLLLIAACAKPHALPAPPAAPSASAVERLRSQILDLTRSPGVERATWGIAVRSLDGNQALVDLNPRALLVPASAAKLVALATAADVAGWDYTFDTSLQATGPVTDGTLHGDLVVVGSGDPSIGGRGGDDLSAWIDAIKRAGITRIDGRIVGDDDRLVDPRPGAMWAWDDIGYTSGALFGALNYAENRMLVTVSPGPVAGAAAIVSVASNALDRPLINRASTGAAGSTPLVWPEQRPGETALTLAGSLPVDGRPVRMFVSAGDPTRWFVNVFRRELEHAGVEVTGGAFDIDDLPQKPDPAAMRPLYTHRSRPLSELAQPMMKESINLYSEAVLRTVATANGGGSNDDALAVMGRRLREWGIPADGLQIVDGSGLSRRDAIAADTLVGILARHFDATLSAPWMRALPIAGRDGSLDDRMRNSAAESNLRAKTGTMSNIRSLAGYVFTRDREPLAFAIMVNNFEGTGAQAVAAIDAMAIRLAEFAR